MERIGIENYICISPVSESPMGGLFVHPPPSHPDRPALNTYLLIPESSTSLYHKASLLKACSLEVQSR